MKLLIINDHGVVGGGTESRISTIMDYFLENGIFQEIHVLQHEKSNNKQREGMVKIHHCPEGNLASYLFTKNIIKKHGIDLVQAHNMAALTPFPVLAAKRLGKPVVWYAHDYWVICRLRNFIDPYNAMQEELCAKANLKKCRACSKDLKTRLKFWLWKKIMNKADLAIGTGRNMLSIYENSDVLKGKWKIITPWINPLFFKKNNYSPKKKGRSKRIIFVGSLIEFKGAWVVVRAFKHILKEIPGSNLILIGHEQGENSRFREKIETIAKKDGVLENIIFLGKKDRMQIKKELEKADVLVFPSVCLESFGQTWAEAMAVGCPPIISNMGIAPEHVDKNKCNGILFEPRNHLDLAEKTINLLNNKQLLKRIRHNCMVYAQNNFNITSIGKEITKIYGEIIIKKY